MPLIFEPERGRDLASCLLALVARAHFTEELPRIDPQIVVIVPGELDCVLADAFRGHGLGRWLEDQQSASCGAGWVSGAAPRFPPFFLTDGARTRVPQIHEVVVGHMTVSPFNVHPGARSKMYLHRFGVCRGRGRMKRRLHEISIA